MTKHLKKQIQETNHLNEILRGAGGAFIFKVIGILLGYVFTVMVARWYGADVLGLFTLSFALLSVFVIVGTMGFDTALVKYIADFNSHHQECLIKEVYHRSLFIVLPVSILLSLLLFYSANYFAISLFSNESLIGYIQIASLAIVPLVLLKVNAAFFRGLKKIQFFSFFQNVGVFASAVIILLVLTFFDQGEKSAIISHVASIFIITVMSFFVLKGYVSNKKLAKRRLSYKNICKVSLPMLFTSSMIFLMGWTDILMLGIFSSGEDVGVYSVLVKLAGLTSIALFAVNTIVAPKFSECYAKGDMQTLKLVSDGSSKMIFYSSIPIILMLAMFSEYILNIFGEEFVVGVSALLILMVGQFMNALSGSVGNLLNMAGHQNVQSLTLFLSAVLNVVLNYVLIQDYGIIGAALATSFVLVFANVLNIYFVKVYLGFYTFGWVVEK